MQQSSRQPTCYYLICTRGERFFIYSGPSLISQILGILVRDLGEAPAVPSPGTGFPHPGIFIVPLHDHKLVCAVPVQISKALIVIGPVQVG